MQVRSTNATSFYFTLKHLYYQRRACDEKKFVIYVMLRKTAQSVLVHRNRINYLTRRSAVTILKLSDIFVDETLTKNKKQQQQKSDVPEKYNDKIKSFDVDCFKNGDHSWEESLSIPTNDVIGTVRVIKFSFRYAFVNCSLQHLLCSFSCGIYINRILLICVR